MRTLWNPTGGPLPVGRTLVVADRGQAQWFAANEARLRRNQNPLHGALGATASEALAQNVRASFVQALDNIGRAGGGGYRLVPTSTTAPFVKVYDGLPVLYYPASEWTNWFTQWNALMQASAAYGQDFPLGKTGPDAAGKLATLTATLEAANPQSTLAIATKSAIKTLLMTLPTVDAARAKAKTTLSKLYPELSTSSGYVGLTIAALVAFGGLAYAMYKVFGTHNIARTVSAMPD